MHGPIRVLFLLPCNTPRQSFFNSISPLSHPLISSSSVTKKKLRSPHSLLTLSHLLLIDLNPKTKPPEIFYSLPSSHHRRLSDDLRRLEFQPRTCLCREEGRSMTDNYDFSETACKVCHISPLTSFAFVRISPSFISGIRTCSMYKSTWSVHLHQRGLCTDRWHQRDGSFAFRSSPPTSC